MAKTRTFIGIGLEPSLSRRAEALVERLRPCAPQARWVEGENLHLTLLFLGDLSDQEVAEACSEADWVARSNQPFDIRLAGVGAFPDIARPRALWLGVTEGSDPMKRLQADLDEALTRLVPRGENRPFVPHLTLGRLARRSGATPERLLEIAGSLSDYDAGRMAVDTVTVYASQLYPDGPEYHVLATCPLGIPKSEPEE